MNSTNRVVANAMAARNAYCEAGDYIETRDGGQDTVERVVGDKVYLKSGEVIRISDVKSVLNAKRVARNAGAYDVAGEAGKLFKDAYNDLAGCAAKLERLTTLGQPDDVPGNDNKIAAWAKDKARKVRDIMNKLDQGRL
jgi:hypothetical protein